MDNKQKKIFKRILESFNLPKNNITFVQHRNLKEFRYFTIERINPNHKIDLYGTLKRNNKKKETSKTYIYIGRLIFPAIFIMNTGYLFQHINFISLILSIFILDCFLFYMFGNINILRRLYDYWNIRFSRRWENNINGQVC